MKSIITFFICVLTLSINAQTVPEVQQTMITKVTATWCTNCGSWGWSFYEDLAEDNDDKALMIKAHSSGVLVNDVSQDLADNFNASSQPRFIVNNTDQNASSSSSATKRTEIKAMVDNAFLQTPTVNAGVTVTLDANNLIIQVRTKFFQTTSGEFYTNVYVVEDNVIANQAGSNGGTNTSHQDIIRTTANSSTFGEQVANGSVSMGTESVQEYTVPINSEWNLDNVEFVAVVWSKSSNTYNFENGSSVSLAAATSIAQDISEEIQLTVQPTLVSHDTNISISLEENQDLSIELMNLQGQSVKNIHTGALASGQHIFNVEKGDLASGIYLVSIQGKNGLATRKIVIQ